jgi:regulator of CtrA degradation
MSDALRSSPEPVILSERLAAGEAFSALFKQGMTLVEATASYLDGPGRKEAKGLPRAAALAYATESMRLTTRLMQLASWLLLQRAVNEGELSAEQARVEKTKVKLTSFDPPHEEMLAMIPKRLRTLIDLSRVLHEQVMRLDAMIYAGAEKQSTDADNPVERQIGLLRAAFEPTDRRA